MLKHIFQTLIALATIQAIIFGLVFILNGKKNRSLVILGFFLVIYVSTGIEWILTLDIVAFLPQLKYLPITFSYCIVPLFYIYVKNIIRGWDKKDFYHLIPALLHFFLELFLFLFPNFGDRFYAESNRTVLVIFVLLLPPIYNIGYAIFTIRYIRIQQKLIPDFFTDIEIKRVNWLITTCFIFIFDYLFEFLFSVVQLNTEWDSFIYLLEAFFMGFIVYWVSIYGIVQKVLLLDDTVVKDSLDNDDLNAENLMDGKVNLARNDKPNPETSENFEKIIAFFKDTKIYTNKEINLFMVSDMLQIPYKEVSRLINTYGQKNFNQFVNSFRIQEAKRLLEDADFEKYNFSGIADAVGFNSRSSFFTNFKQIEGITPLDYKRSLEGMSTISKAQPKKTRE